jgi:hypothetical protein
MKGKKQTNPEVFDLTLYKNMKNTGLQTGRYGMKVNVYSLTHEIPIHHRLKILSFDFLIFITEDGFVSILGQTI